MIRNKIIDKNEKPSIAKVFAAGLLSGSIGPILNNPFDVVKTRYMNPKYNDKYKNMLDAFKSIIKEEGYGSLWKGIYLRIFRVAGGQAIVFSVIEQLTFYSNKLY